ncbi:MAG: starch-binding protein [Treponema sp.]|nr:starch-binding protein [Treponema sp.]
MKRLFSRLLLLISAFMLISCSNLALKDDSNIGKTDLEYGTLIIGSNDKSIQVDDIVSAKVTVIGSDFTESVVTVVDSVVSGKGTYKIEKIPAGDNRVVIIDAFNSESQMEGITITAVVDIKVGDNVLEEINWDTTVKGNVYKELIKAGVATAEFTDEQEAKINSAIPVDTHPCLVDSVSLAEDYKANPEGAFSANDYKLTTGSVVFNAKFGSGYSFYLNDPLSEYTKDSQYKVTADDATLKKYTITGVAPGNWKIYVKDADDRITEKEVAITSGEETNIGNYVGKEKIDGYRVHFYGASWSAYNLYYYSSDEANSGAAWPGKPMSKSADGNTYYIDLKDTWVKGGDTLCIFTEKDSGTNRYPADMQPGVALPIGTNEVWFNFSSKQFETINPFSTDPEVTLSPSGDYQYSSVNMAVTITAKNCTTAKYTIDGSDPKAFGTEFTSSKVITIGDTCEIGDIVKVRVWGTDGNLESSTSATYKKVDKPSTPTRLGAYYTKSATSFSIWSPDSSNVKVVVTPKGGSAKEYACSANFQVDGNYPDASKIYGVTVSGDLHLAEYQFKINGTNVRDPYGVMVKYDGNQQKTNVLKSNGLENGFNYTAYAGPSANIVIDLDQTDPEGGWAERPKLDNRNDAIVYEVHVGDFTSDTTWGGTAANAGKFPGMVETGTKYGTVSTGIDHLKELGVTHVQLLPFYDYATKHNTTLNDIYNWGYDPVNYNVPEDRFSTCPSDYVERIREVKEMINEFHKNGIRVIMDVVYNHTFDKEMFKNISTKYYTTTDLSGCGNSINTGVSMVSRMIRDSLEYWVDEYNIDGFRFDLIGIYHTSAVKDWGNYMNNTKFPDRMLLMYGEPWNGYADDAEEGAKVRMSAVSSLTSAKVGVFNGKYRQSLKGSNDTGKRGYIFNQNEDDGTAYAANIAVGLKGSLTSLDKSDCSDTSGTWTRFFTGTPDQSINYISAHDNLCLWDKIGAAAISDNNYAQRIVKFGHGILLVSQGIPFIHAGDEFLRTKHKGDGSSMAHNSYMAGIKTNSIDWKLKSTNNGIFKYHSDLIKLRKDNDGLRNRKGVGTTEVAGNAVKYYVQNTNGTKLCIVVNPGNNIEKPVSGTTIFDVNGLSPKSSDCEGTAVTVIKY